MLDASEVYNEPRSNNAYIVRSGDTICKIAEKFKVPCKALMALNNVNPRGDIFRGQRLKLPEVETSKTTSSESDKGSSSKNKWEIGGKKASSTSKSIEKKKVVTGNTEAQPLYFYTHENFYVITRYNHSVLYAMAVHDLSQAIAQAKAKLDNQSQSALKK